MIAAGALQTGFLDVPTLVIVSIALAGLLGLFLVISWIQDRDVRPLAWWGSAYLIGAASMALWVTPEPRLHVPPEVPEALALLACGVIWSGIRLFHGRELRPLGALAGAILWPVLCQLPQAGQGTYGRVALGASLVAAYTFVIAWELWRERRLTLFSRAAAVIVPCLHAAIFLMPLAMPLVLSEGAAVKWLTVFALESIIYAVGTAFIVLLMVKDHHVHVYRRAATTDHLTGLPNRRAFLQGAVDLCSRQARKREPVTLMMFDLDHFKSINDRFGHATGDEALKVFAQVLRHEHARQRHHGSSRRRGVRRDRAGQQRDRRQNCRTHPRRLRGRRPGDRRSHHRRHGQHWRRDRVQSHRRYRRTH